MLFFGNKYVKGVTQFIQADHFNTVDFIDYHCEKMGLSREEYMAFYRTPVDYRLVEANSFADKWERLESDFKRIIDAPGQRVYDLVDFVQFNTGGMTERDWEKFMYGRYKKHLQSKDTKTKEKMYKVLKKMVTESVISEKADQKNENDESPLDDSAMETGIKNKADETGVPIGLLRIIMRRGLAAWKTGHRPGATQAQWGYARVNSFLTKQPGTWGKADSDIAKKVRDGGHDKNLKKA